MFYVSANLPSDSNFLFSVLLLFLATWVILSITKTFGEQTCLSFKKSNLQMPVHGSAHYKSFAWHGKVNQS